MEVREKKSEYTQFCQRCMKGTNTTQMSMFNTQICCSECIEKERAHPDFPKAREAEQKALQDGDYNYVGIGLPDDLNPLKSV